MDNSITSALGRRLKSQFDLDKKDRQPMEDQWLQDQRDYQGEYDPTTLKNIRSRPGSSEAFVRLTRTKVKTVDARIGDLITGSGKRNWEMEPTPAPDYEGATGVAKDDFDKAAIAAEKMTTEVYDQLVEAKYLKIFRDVYHSGHKLGVGIVKGPLVQQIVEKRWKMMNGKPAIIESQTVRPYIEFCPIWDYYPEMAARDLYATERDQQRHLMTKGDLYRLAQRPDFIKEAILEHVGSNPNGDAEWTYWEQQIMQIGRFDASTKQTDLKRYEVVEFWGVVEIEELRQAGADISQDIVNGVVEANVWFFASSGRVIKADLNPFKRGTRPFSFYVPDPEEERLFGMSVPYIMRDTARLLNGAVRMWVDNAAFSAGPQVEIDVDRLVNQNDIELLRPFRIWLTKGEAYHQGQPAIRFNSFTNQGAQLVMMVNVMKSLSDEATAIPSYQSGERASSGAGRTAEGLNLLMGAASLMLKEQLASWDEFQDNFLTRMFDWNMQFSAKDDIKGDMRVNIIGSHSLALKAQRAQQLQTFATSTANPVDAPLIKRRQLLQLLAEAYDLPVDKIVMTDADMKQQLEDAKAKLAELDRQQLTQPQTGGPAIPPGGVPAQPPVNGGANGSA